MPTMASRISPLTWDTAPSTPLPAQTVSPSLNSTASWVPMLAPEGTAARPRSNPPTQQSTSIVGLPRESRIIRAERSLTAPLIDAATGPGLLKVAQCGTMCSANSASGLPCSGLRVPLARICSSTPSIVAPQWVRWRTVPRAGEPHPLPGTSHGCHRRNSGGGVWGSDGSCPILGSRASRFAGGKLGRLRSRGPIHGP